MDLVIYETAEPSSVPARAEAGLTGDHWSGQGAGTHRRTPVLRVLPGPTARLDEKALTHV